MLLLGLVFAPSSVFQQLFSALGLSAGVARDTAAGLDTEGGAEVNSECTGTGDEDASQEDSSVNAREIMILISLGRMLHVRESQKIVPYSWQTKPLPS